MASNKRPPLEMDDLTSNLKQSTGKGVDAFFASPNIKPPIAKHENIESDSPTLPQKTVGKKQQKEAKLYTHDVVTSSRQDVNYRKWRDIIEDTEVHNSALRLTNEERYDIEDLISELRRKYKIKTSMNEIARLGLLYIIHDFKKDRQNSLIIKVKKS